MTQYLFFLLLLIFFAGQAIALNIEINVTHTGAPESFTRDTKRGQWVLGSMFAPVFTVVDDMGAVVETRDISSVTDGHTTFGVYYVGDTVYAVAGNPYEGKDAYVVAWNRETDALKVWDLSELSGQEKNLVNDLVVTDDESFIYVTDSSNAVVYMIDIASDVSSILVGNEDLPNGEWTPYEYEGMMLGPNGIELVRGTNGAAAEYLLVGMSLRQPSLYRVHIASKTVELVHVQDVDGIWAGNVGIDGLRFASDGSLAAMTYMNSGAVLGVLRLTSADMWASASIVGVDRAPAPEGLMRTTLAYTENSATWVIATSFEGKSPVQISEVAFTSLFTTSPTSTPTISPTSAPTLSPTSAPTPSLSPDDGDNVISDACIVSASLFWGAFVVLIMLM